MLKTIRQMAQNNTTGFAHHSYFFKSMADLNFIKTRQDLLFKIYMPLCFANFCRYERYIA